MFWPGFLHPPGFLVFSFLQDLSWLYFLIFTHATYFCDSCHSDMRSCFKAGLTAASFLFVQPPERPQQSPKSITKPTFYFGWKKDFRKKSDWFFLWGWTSVSVKSSGGGFGNSKTVDVWLHMAHKGLGRSGSVYKDESTQEERKIHQNVKEEQLPLAVKKTFSTKHAINVGKMA